MYSKIDKETKSKSYPLTSEQLGVYFSYAENPNTTEYNCSFYVPFDKKEDIDPYRLSHAVKSVIENHSAFYFNIDNVNGIPSMIPCDRKMDVPVINMNEADFLSYAKSFVRPFNLKEDALFRAEIVLTQENVYFLYDYHHIAFDGTSGGIIFKEIGEAYSGKALNEEEISVFELSDAERNLENSDEYKKSLEYFRGELEGADLNNGFPVDGVDENDLSAGIVNYSINIDIDEYINNSPFSVNSLLVGAYAYTISKFNNGNSALIGMVENGRHRTFLRRANTVGFLVRTLPLALNIPESGKISDYLTSVHTKAHGIIHNDIVPFVVLHSEFGVNNDFIFAYQSNSFNSLRIGDTESEMVPIPIKESIGKLAVAVYKTQSGFRFEFSYRKSLFNAGIIESLAKSFGNAVKEFVTKENLDEVVLTDESEIALLDSFNDNDDEIEGPDIITVLRRQVEKHPDKTAVVFKDTRLTFNEFDRITDNLASYLKANGIEKDDVVAVLVPRSEMMAITAYGIAKSGAGFQPLDCSYPVERLKMMTEDSEAKVVIMPREYGNMLPDFDGNVLFTEDIYSLPEANTDIKDIKVGNDDLFVLLYSSGTTGTPKGVQLTFGNMLAQRSPFGKIFNVNSEKKIASYASFGFDACIMDLFCSLTFGAELHIIPEEIRMDLPAMDEYFIQNGITDCFMTTQVGRQFAQYTNSKTLENIVVGGEKLVPIDITGKPFCLWNGYGPSECTMGSSYFRVNGDYARVPLGRTVNNMKGYIVDSRMNRVPVGVPGELILAGRQIGRGYLKRPELTQKAFIDNPFNKDDNPEYRMAYRTGDIVRFLPDGTLDFIGRSDSQVKVRGFRIELSEVEKVIREFDGIEDATVADFDAPAGGKFIAAYIVSNSRIDISALKSFISSKKPYYMIPEFIMQIDKIPLNQNQKVNKRALPKPERTSANKANTQAEPDSAMRMQIREILNDVIGSSDMGAGEELSLYGMNSLSFIILSAALGKKFGVNVDIRKLMHGCRIIDIENLIVEDLMQKNAHKVSEAKTDSDVAPLSLTQEGILVECMANPGTVAYNIPYLLKIDNGIDINKLKSAIAEAVAAHSCMDAELFTDENGKTKQRIGERSSFTENDIEEIECDNINNIIGGLIKPFNLFGDRLFRVILIHAENPYLFIDIHHIISDGMSMNILIRDISNAYSGNTPEKESFTSFDVALDEQVRHSGNNLEDAEKYYESILSVENVDFLLNPDRISSAPKDSGVIVADEKNVKYADVVNFCEKSRCSINGFMCAAFGYVLAKYNCSDYSVFTTVYNGRADSRTENTVSMLVKTLPICCTVEPEEKTAPAALAAAVSKQLVDSMANDIFSFAEISRKFGVTSDVMFIYQGDNFNRDSFCKLPCDEIELNAKDSKAPIAVQVFVKNGILKYHIDYDSERYTEPLISAFIGAFDKALAEFITQEYLGDISLADDASTALMDSFNDTDDYYDKNDTAVSLFLKNAKKNPDGIAVSFVEKNITYSELERRSGNIASYLSGKGIGRGDFVGMLVGRNCYMPEIALGVIRAGAAYQPLDSSYPAERINFMISDANVRFVIADRNLAYIISDFDGEILYTDELDSLPEAENFSDDTVKPKDAFVIIYTSGTTGTPKGNIMEHRNLVCLIHNIINLAADGDFERVAQYSSFGFDAGIMETFTALLTGNELHIVPENIRLDMAKLDEFMIEKKITAIDMTTQIGRLYLTTTKSPYLRYAMFGGEKLVPFCPGENMRIYNGYGPTEAMVFVTAHRIADADKVQPIGKINLNTKGYILDKFNHRLPIGAAGELCVAGTQIGRGYLNRPEKTAEVFVENPFEHNNEYARMYRTGDVVRLLPTGEYDFIGRRDGQVKIRGFRVELTEVELAVRSYPGVINATVQAFEDSNSGKYLAAYVVSDSEISPEDMKSFLAKDKPPYMIPSVIMQIDSIPVNVNNKVDKKKLPQPVAQAKTAGREPETETEKILCKVCADVLNIPHMFADDNFFDLGGTSILAASIIMQLMSEGIKVEYQDIFDYPQPEAMAELIESRKNSAKSTSEDGEKQANSFGDVLKENALEYAEKVKREPLGDVVLTGAVGFLGIHILKELIELNEGRIICVVRKNSTLSAKERIQNMLFYYFDNSYDEAIKDRISIVDADVTDETLPTLLSEFHYDTIINCAAIVKHYAQDDSISRVNVHGVEVLIECAKQCNARLVQISTVSIPGFHTDETYATNLTMHENELFVVSDLDNKYIGSKYQAEVKMLEAIRSGMRGKIIRVGNLMGRYCDGEFQINFRTNAFIKALKGFATIGKCPISHATDPMKFSPIDLTAHAVILLAGTNDCFTAFHADNRYGFDEMMLIQACNSCGITIKPVPDEEYYSDYYRMLGDDHINSNLSGLITNDRPDIHVVDTDNKFTANILYRIGFSWPFTDCSYLERAIRSLDTLNFFELDEFQPKSDNETGNGQ